MASNALDMINQLQVWAIVGVALLAAIVADWVFTGEWQWTVLLRVGIAAGVVAGSIMVFDRCLWRWKRLQGWFVHRPNISGVWYVVITPRKADPTTGKPRPRRNYEYHIHQTYSQLFVRMTGGPESEGETISANTRRLDDGNYELIVVYQNTPKERVRERSEIHRGCAKLKIIGGASSPEALEGSYWTDRETRGEIQGSRSPH